MTECRRFRPARPTPKGVNDGKGFVFINHRGEVYPSRFLPLSAGNVTTQPLAEVYCDSPLFVSLRDSSRLKGKCGRCPVRDGLRRIARPRLRHDRRPVRHRPLLRLRTVERKALPLRAVRKERRHPEPGAVQPGESLKDRLLRS